MLKIKKQNLEIALSAALCGFGCWLILILSSRISLMLDLPKYGQMAFVLIVWLLASYQLLLRSPAIISWLLKNKRAAQGGEPPKRYDYRKEITDPKALKAGDCRGFMRLIIFEEGVFADGEYTKLDLIYAIARVMVQQPHFAVEMQTAMLCYKLMAKGDVSTDIIATIVNSAAKNCPCEHCVAERAIKEREATNN